MCILVLCPKSSALGQCVYCGGIQRTGTSGRKKSYTDGMNSYPKKRLQIGHVLNT